MAVRMTSAVYPHGPVFRSMAELHRKPRDIDSVAGGVAFVGGVRPLQKIGDVAQDLAVAEGQVLVQNGQFLIALRKIDQDLRLQAGVDVFRKIERAGVVVHRGDEAEQRMRLDLDPRDNRFDIAAGIEQRGQARPAFLAHAVAFVEDHDAAS